MSEYHGVLLASGGLDSTTMYYAERRAGRRLLPLFLDYGQHCRETELATLREVLPSDADNVHVLDISCMYAGSRSRLIDEADLWRDEVTDDDMYLPYRNLLFLSVASAFAQDRGIEAVYAAFINSNHAKEIDCSTEFFDRLGEVLRDYGTVQVRLPFRAHSKTDVVRLAIKLGVPLARTYSCQIAAKVPCGACPNCVERLDALATIADEISPA
jgi:7-cyano-7-deazaguanine synthase